MAEVDVTFWVQILSIIIGVCIIVQGILGLVGLGTFFGFQSIFPTQFVWLPYGKWLWTSDIMLPKLMSEVREWGFLAKFQFLYTYAGRGMFQIFVGTLCWSGQRVDFGWIVGIICVILGFLQVIIGLCCTTVRERRPLYGTSGGGREPATVVYT